MVYTVGYLIKLRILARKMDRGLKLLPAASVMNLTGILSD